MKKDKRKTLTDMFQIGSWLLTKEACGTLSASLTLVPPTQSGRELFARSGDVLITTMTSLKHQGAAFAAHKAFQQIASQCIKVSSNPGLRPLPSEWSKRLLSEISSTERVRDSTLRRSTGYALGFLSMMRSEPLAAVAPKSLCPVVLSELVALSLPPKQQLEIQLSNLGLSVGVSLFSQTFLQWRKSSSKSSFIDEAVYEVSWLDTRRHASKTHTLPLTNILCNTATLSGSRFEHFAANYLGRTISF